MFLSAGNREPARTNRLCKVLVEVSIEFLECRAVKAVGNDAGVASYPELRGCLTSGETAEAALKNALDCKREWLAAALEDGYEIPEPTSDDEYSGQFKLRLPKSLHRALAENSKREGISMNQYCLYLLTKNNAEFRHGA